jgi:hypothetical protein
VIRAAPARERARGARARLRARCVARVALAGTVVMLGIVGVPAVSTAGTSDDFDASEAGRAPRVVLSGKLHADLIRDFGRVDPASNATLRPSTIPVRCPGDPGCGPGGETIASVRQSTLGVRASLPTRAGTFLAGLTVDLFESPGGTTRPRVLDVYAALGPIALGQFYSVFMNIDTFPDVLDYWGPNGMVFLRTPQLRWTPVSDDGTEFAISIEAPAAAIDAGKAATIDPGLEVRARAARPDLAARWVGRGERGQVSAAAVVRRIAYESVGGQGTGRSGVRTGWGVNLNGALQAFGRDRVVAQLAVGDAIASYVNDGGVDLAPDARLRASTVRSVAAFAYYERHWSSRWRSAAGYGLHRQQPLAGQLPGAFRHGRYASANLTWRSGATTVGVELLWGEHAHADGARGDDLRLQLSTIYRF